MKSRIKQIRALNKLTQSEFAASIDLSQNYIAQVEIGKKDLGDRAVRDICRIYGINEAWLRTGAGEMYADKTREQMIQEEIGRLMTNAPDSFKAALIAALLRFGPDGPEWTILEDVYNSVAAELVANPPKE